MEWIFVVLMIIAVWVLFDIANKLHDIARDIEVVKSRLTQGSQK